MYNWASWQAPAGTAPSRLTEMVGPPLGREDSNSTAVPRLSSNLQSRIVADVSNTAKEPPVPEEGRTVQLVKLEAVRKSSCGHSVGPGRPTSTAPKCFCQTKNGFGVVRHSFSAIRPTFLHVSPETSMLTVKFITPRPMVLRLRNLNRKKRFRPKKAQTPGGWGDSSHVSFRRPPRTRPASELHAVL